MSEESTGSAVGQAVSSSRASLRQRLARIGGSRTPTPPILEPLLAQRRNRLRREAPLAIDRVGVERGDLRDPDRVLGAPGVSGLLDFSRPVGLLMFSVFQHVADGDVSYFLAGGGTGRGMGAGRGAGGDRSSATEITAWVEATYSSTIVDGVTVYDLTQPVA